MVPEAAQQALFYISWTLADCMGFPGRSVCTWVHSSITSHACTTKLQSVYCSTGPDLGAQNAAGRRMNAQVPRELVRKLLALGRQP